MADGRTRRAEQVREQRRAQILAAALQVFADRGYHGAAVSDLVKAAGVARGTFYLYFDSKESVFLELLDELLTTLRRSVQGVKMGSDVPSAEDQLVGIVGVVLETVQHNRALTRIIFREAIGLDPKVDAKLADFYGELNQYIVAALKVGELTGMVRSVADPELVATCVVGSFRAVVQQYAVNRDEPLDLASLSKGIVDLHLQGLRP